MPCCLRHNPAYRFLKTFKDHFLLYKTHPQELIDFGKKIHLDSEQHLGNNLIRSSLINMYGKCKYLPEAHIVFNNMEYHDVVAWTSLIMAYVENHQPQPAIAIFSHMLSEGCVPNARTYIAVTMACSAKQKTQGVVIHAQALETGYCTNLYLGNSLMDMYSRCGNVMGSRYVFDTMPVHSVVSWTTLIRAYVENGYAELALEVFQNVAGVLLDARTFVVAIAACSSLSMRKEGNRVEVLAKVMDIHLESSSYGFDSNLYVASALIDVYSKCGSMGNALAVFDRLAFPDVVAWTALLVGYVENGQSLRALDILDRMHDVRPNSTTYVAALTACGNLAASEEDGDKAEWLERGRSIHKRLYSNEKSKYVVSALVTMYSRCGSLTDAKRAFEQALHTERDVPLWNAMMFANVENGYEEAAIASLAEMQCEGLVPDNRSITAALMAYAGLAAKGNNEMKKRCLHKGVEVETEGVSTLFVANALISLYMKCGSIYDAERVFDTCEDTNAVSWNTMIQGYVENGRPETALHLYMRMKVEKERLVDYITLVSALKCCESLGALQDGKHVHHEACVCGLETKIGNTLVEFYFGCGSVLEAERVFIGMSLLNTMVWNSMMAGYSRVGEAGEVLALFMKMQEECIHTDGVTFVILLMTCSHAGLTREGLKWFETMVTGYRVKPGIEHCNCVVDLLARAGRVQDALQFIRGMDMRPSLDTWRVLMGACAKWKDVEIGKVVFESVMEIDADQGAAYVQMASAYKLFKFV